MRKYLVVMLMFMFISCITFASNITITSEVDKTNVEFGEVIQLTILIKKPTSQSMNQTFGNGGFSFSFNSINMSSMNDIDFNIESIPNFDIMGRSQSSQSRMVNGVGESTKKIVLSLVPQKEGELIIPEFSIKDKDGEEHHSEVIKINVKKGNATSEENVQENSSGEEENDNINTKENEPNQEKDSNNILFKALLYIGIAFIAVFIIIIVAVYFLTHNTGKNSVENQNTIEDAEIVEVESVSKPESKPIEKENVEKVDFTSIAASLKVQYKEVTLEFYEKYFDLFKKACCYRNKSLSKDMTFDELFKKCMEIANTDNIKQAASRMAYDIEMVMYAKTMPNRQLISIETDIKEILNAL